MSLQRDLADCSETWLLPLHLSVQLVLPHGSLMSHAGYVLHSHGNQL
jgi:hypothetical protein